MGVTTSTVALRSNASQKKLRSEVSLREHLTEAEYPSPMYRYSSRRLHHSRSEAIFSEFKWDNGKINNYKILFRVASNSHRTVSKVINNITQETFALKFLSKTKLFKKGEKAVQQANAEVRILRSINTPFIVRFFDCWQGSHNLYIITEYVAGGELFSLWKILGSLSESLIQFTAAQLIIALDFLNRHNVIYRDLKMENVLLDHRGYLKLIDFGSAKSFTNDSNFLTRTVCGTLSYCAPEMLAGIGYSFSVDWWALGILCHVLATGCFPVKPGRNFTEMFRLVNEHNYSCPPSFSPDLIHLISQLLQKDPKRRATNRYVLECFDFFKSINFDTLESRQYDPRQFFTRRDINRIPESFLKRWILEDQEDPYTPSLTQTIGNFSWTAPSESQHITSTPVRSRTQSVITHKPKPLIPTTKRYSTVTGSITARRDSQNYSPPIVIMREGDVIQRNLHLDDEPQSERSVYRAFKMDSLHGDMQDKYEDNDDDSSTIVGTTPKICIRQEFELRSPRLSFQTRNDQTKQPFKSDYDPGDGHINNLVSKMRFVPFRGTNLSNSNYYY